MFLEVPNFDGVEVNEYGAVRNSNSKRVYKPWKDRDGYLTYNVKAGNPRKTRRLTQHRAVALAFIPNPENKPQVNHIGSDRANNHVTNLEWVTPKENSVHASIYGNLPRGSDNGNSVYEEAIVRQACELLSINTPAVKVARLLNVKVNFVNSLLSGSWGRVTKDYQLKTPKAKMTEDTVRLICQQLSEGASNPEIANRFSHLGVTRGICLHIKKRKTFKEISKDYIW